MNYTFNTDGTLHTKTDSGGTTTYGYDSYGQLSSVAYFNGLGSETFVNSAFGDVTSHTDANGNVTTFAYNSRRELTNSLAPTNIVTSTVYDAVGNVAAKIDPRLNVTSNAWSATSHLLTLTLPSTPLGVAVVTNVYDSRDWLTITADPLRNASLYTNDLDGRTIAATDPEQRTTIFCYDADGHKLATVNAANETNSQTWDARGSLIRLTDGAGHISTRAYDASGNQIILTNRNGKQWQFQFDGANRLTNTISPLGHSGSVAFNHQGLPILLIDPAGQITTNVFDARARLTSRGDKVALTTNLYDPNNNLTSVSENGNSNIWTYDAYNRVSSYRDVYGNLIQYRHDTSGNLTNLIYPGNRTVAYAYDNLNHLTNVTDWAGRVTTLAYDLDGHLTRITRPNGTFRTISYDAAGQVTNIWEQMANSLPIAWFRLNWTNSGNMAWEFAAPLPHTNTPPTRTMTYDADNRLLTFNGSSVVNDLDGNLTTGPLTNAVLTNYIYDARNRLSNVGGVTNAYDAVNNRVGQAFGTITTICVVNPNAKLSQVLVRIKNGVTNYYIYGVNLLYQITEAAAETNTLTYHYDYRGSTVALSADNGLVTDRIEYSTYGLTTYRAGTNDTPFLFNGRYGVQTDPNGLLYMRARYYNPFICRFINADPSGFAAGLNFYAFCNGNPISNKDPFGLQPSPANLALGFSPGYGQNLEEWNNQFQAASQQSLAMEGSLSAGAAIGAGGATLIGAGAVGLVGLGVPASTVTGGLLVLGSGGIVTTGYSIYNDPSVNNIAFNAGGLAGGFLVGGLTSSSVVSTLSPPGYQPSGAVSLSSDVAMAWRSGGPNGNINPIAFLMDWLLPGAQVGPMSTGPSTAGAVTTVGGFGAGVAAGSQLISGSSTGKTVTQ
jgi:RHS repeat-associated protein